MKNEENKNDLSVYRVGKISLLQLMALLAILGVVLYWVLLKLVGG